MKKRRLETILRRVFAIALALIMMLSTVELSSIRVLAAENTDEIVSEETTAEDSEGVTEEYDVDTKDEVKALPYTGTISEDDEYGRTLGIHESHMKAHGMQVNAENMIAIIQAQTEPVNRVIIDVSDTSGFHIITKELWNEALTILTENAEFKTKFISFQSYINSSLYVYEFLNPVKIQQDVDVAFSYEIGEPEEGLSFQFEQVDFACTTFFDFFTIEGCEEYEPMRAAYGLHDSYAFFDGEKQIINQHVSVYTDEPGYVMTSFGFGSVLEPGKTYTIKGVTEECNDELPYMGDVAENEWYGKILTISAEAMDAAGMDVTLENIHKILDAQTQKFQLINFCCYDSELFAVVPKELWNKAVSSMEETEFEPMMTFNWRNVKWCFAQPQTVNEDVGLILNNSFSEADEGINVVFEQLVIPAEHASIELEYHKAHSDFSQIGAFIDETAEYGLFVGKEKFEDVDSHVYDEMYAFTFDCSETLKAGKTYTIKAVNSNETGGTLPPGTEIGPFDENGNYIGFAYTMNDDSSVLELSSNAIEADFFNTDICEEVVSYWASQGIKFDHIFVTQNAAGGYVIKKDIYEMLRTRILSAKNGQINFQFQNLIEPGSTSNDVAIPERNETKLVWGFDNPEPLESDINAEVSIQLSEDKETVLTFADKREYNEGTFVLVSATENNDLYQNVLLPGLGEAKDFAAASEQPLYVFYKHISLIYNSVASVRYWTDGNCTDLIVDDMSKIDTSVPVVLFNPSVTIDKGLLDTVNGLVLEVEEGATDVAFLSVSGDINIEHFTEDWVLYALRENSTVTIICTYLNALGERVTELWNYNTVHGATTFKFTYPEIELEWDGTDNGDVHFLEVAYLPATENIWPDTCTWEVVSGNGIEFLPDYYYANGWGSKYPYKITGFGETVVKVSYAGASTTCVIRVLPKVNVPEIPTIYAAPQVNGTLADIDLNAIVKGAEGTFAWKDASVKFADYAGSDSMHAEALYTVKGRKSVSVLVRVELVWITGVEIGAYDKTQANCQYYVALPDSIKKDEKIVLCAELLTNNSSKEAVDLLKKYVKEGKFSVKWTDKEKGDLLSEELISESAIFAPRSYTATAKGKKTLQASVMSANSKKAIATGKANLVVTANDVFSFAPEVFELTDANPTEMKGVITVKVASENYKIAKKLTVKSEDNSVLKLGKVKTENAESFVTITIPYEFVKAGTTTLSVISADEVKTAKGFKMERVDYAPKMGTASVTLDKGLNDAVPGDFVEIFSHDDVVITSKMKMKEAEHAKNFDIMFAGDSMYLVTLKNPSLKNGTYNVTLQAEYTVKGEEKQFESKLKIVVKETNIKLTIKQNVPYNEFYKKGDDIEFTTKVAKGALVNMEIADQNSPFILHWNETNKYALSLRDEFVGKDLTVAQKKVTLKYEVHADAANYIGKTTFTVKTVKKAPKVSGFWSIKSNVGEMNTYYGITALSYTPVFSDTKGALDSLEGKVQLVDAKTGKLTELVTFNWGDESKGAPVKVGKNTYYLYTSWNGICVELANTDTAVKATDVMKFRISNDNWKGTVDVTIKNKVLVSKTKVKLSKNTLTLNVNEAMYRDAYDYIDVQIGNSGNVSSVATEGTRITGLDEKSKKAMEHNLKIEGYLTEISVSVVDKGDKKAGTYLETGIYKYKAETKLGAGTVSFNFNVKIVDESLEKSIKVTKKGSIDVLDRYDTYMTFSVTEKGNLEYLFLEDMYLEGADAALFNAYYDGYGNCKVYAKDGVQLSTKKKYKVTPVCKYEDVIVKAAPVTFQVKQGSVKFVKSSHGDTLYANKGNQMLIFPEAYTNGKWTEIKNVELLNYTDDLKYENGILSFRTDKEPTTIKKSQGTYTLKFAVTLADGAVDKKPLTFTCKVKIVR